jgi:AAHS family 4-hydroxybenzoate transporter-like MFS transporter
MTDTGQRIDVAALIENQKLNGFRVAMIVLACIVMGVEGYDMQVLSYAAPSIIRDWHVNKASFGHVFGLGLFGYLLGATLLCQLADRLGRKKLIIGGCLLFGAFTFATGYASNLTELLVFRFLAGVGLGASIPTTIALAAEYTPSRVRAMTVGVMFIGYNIGGALGGVIAAKFLATLGWPVLFQVGGIGPLILAAALVFVLPESVRFLSLRQNQPERVAAILTKLTGGRSFAPGAQFVLQEENRKGIPVKHLFTEGRAMMTSLLWLAYISSLMGHYFLSSWLPTVVAGTGATMATAVMAGAMFQVGGGVGNLIVCRFLDKRGIVAVAIAFVLAAPLTVLIGVAGSSSALLMTLVFLNGLCMLGGQVGLNAISGTVYPTYIRSTGAGWAFGIGRIGSITGPVLGGILINILPTSSLFLCAAIPVVFCAGTTYFLGREPLARQASEAAAIS